MAYDGTHPGGTDAVRPVITNGFVSYIAMATVPETPAALQHTGTSKMNKLAATGSAAEVGMTFVIERGMVVPDPNTVAIMQR